MYPGRGYVYLLKKKDTSDKLNLWSELILPLENVERNKAIFAVHADLPQKRKVLYLRGLVVLVGCASCFDEVSVYECYRWE